MKTRHLIMFLIVFLSAITVYGYYSAQTASDYDKINETFTNEIATSPDYCILMNIPAQEGSPAVIAFFETGDQKEIGMLEYTLKDQSFITVPKEDEDVSAFLLRGQYQTLIGAHIPKTLAEDMDIAYVSYYDQKEGQSYIKPIEDDDEPYYFITWVDLEQDIFELTFLDSNKNELFKREL
ncbi:hypothetical protein [Alkalicoccobacillus plakortidis]|uniref:DUF5590 domain-containing protein n=1 Tax=Alkalicoccobacillus plakortidis TaxID=444060 RepID=A0ABT0XRY0_9BACI|nr:hypothetical protein [Alkalicoccobacillus plakortidis]MCM2678029.1 hypothetical protein [Alkalicoccobacillus plakortidis]